MRTFIIAFFLLGISSVSWAQSSVRDKIESRKIALITEKLELTPDQAERFWPIYREFSTRRQEIRQEFTERRRNFDPKQATEEEMKRMIDLGLQVKQQQVNLEKDYSERMRNIISDRQLLNLRRAEDEFRQMLLDRVRARRQQTQRSREQNDNLRNRRRNN